MKTRYFVVTEHDELGAAARHDKSWHPIGPAIEVRADNIDPCAADVEAAVREKYSPGQVIPNLFLVMVVPLSTTQAIHVEVDVAEESCE